MRTSATLQALWRDEEGATAPEYALIAAFVALAIFAAVQALGLTLRMPFQSVKAGIETRTM